jgi:hypothetical protein
VKKLLAILALLALIGTARADNKAELTVRGISDVNSFISTASPATAADTLASITSNTVNRPTPTNGKPNLSVSARFSASGANCYVTVLRGETVGNKWVVWSVSRVQITQAGDNLIDTLYAASDSLFSTLGAPEFKILVDTISSGSVQISVTRY